MTTKRIFQILVGSLSSIAAGLLLLEIIKLITGYSTLASVDTFLQKLMWFFVFFGIGATYTVFAYLLFTNKNFNKSTKIQNILFFFISVFLVGFGCNMFFF